MHFKQNRVHMTFSGTGHGMLNNKPRPTFAIPHGSQMNLQEDRDERN